MSTAGRARLHHLALTVTDLDASVQWYGEVFDVHPVMDIPHQGGVGRILADADQQLMIALHRHDTNDGGLAAETTTGLDHAGFTIGSREELELWQEHLEANGVIRADTADKPLTQSPIADEPYASVLVFRDRDNIQLELFAPVKH
ncbi:catechol 2,3-dioxygenase-like lactoylglutathione lyase family enzyme [Kribbella sp. VKM Ac-2527]|uniref:Catechol 2,3-dioxygenase-like lactoylglutathione lyase family enzyme n=1 Tax=Kribbella caucasensis TaxID=2512215 RepID=A0A4V3C8X9_9ACTN|nr:VOC family protein [Kribbella sp. VKM Ac-2527]TDO43298.1 catechol 2,3-dioxygenase-like lactoylglutathione lyase family enzyme [Kribbella sp. VKM Ac-2527]